MEISYGKTNFSSQLDRTSLRRISRSELVIGHPQAQLSVHLQHKNSMITESSHNRTRTPPNDPIDKDQTLPPTSGVPKLKVVRRSNECNAKCREQEFRRKIRLRQVRLIRRVNRA